MELVYLWVEDYKNIHKQGFNFSPRFKCKFKDEYDENGKLKDNCELIIDENKEYVSIFPNNINITAIVGENGSGKSSVGGEFYAKITSYYLDKRRLYTQTKFVFLINLNNQYYSVTNINYIQVLSSHNSEINVNKAESFIEIEEENNFYTSCALSEYTGREYSFSDPYVKSKNSILGLMRGEINESNENEINELLKKITFTYKNSKIDSSRQNSKISFFNKDKELRFNSLSFGEKYTLNIFLQVYNRLKEKKPYVIFLDEVTMSMHPDWQRVYIKDIINLFQKYNVHFIITTHSPFILSDLPKENVIFLKNGKQIDVDIDSFGANIHTLLSHGFFMKEGLMGEFAKSKIDEVIKYLNGKNDTQINDDKDAQSIVNIIGEPIIKRELQRMLKNKMELSNKTEIDKIREKVDTLTKELEESSKRLEELENKDKK